MKRYPRPKIRLRAIWNCFFPKTFSDKYHHLGYSHPSVPEPWVKSVEECLIKLEKLMWPKRWMPMWSKRLIHYLYTDNSVVRVMYPFFGKIKERVSVGGIAQIKDKYATLRIYISGTEEMYDIVRECEDLCASICESCGSTEDVKIVGGRWVSNLCKSCRKEK